MFYYSYWLYDNENQERENKSNNLRMDVSFLKIRGSEISQTSREVSV